MADTTNIKDLFPFDYKGKTYKRGDRFLNDCAYEILNHPYLKTKTPFTGVQWKKLLPTSYEIARARKMQKQIIGRVNYAIGHPCHPAFAIEVKKPGRKIIYTEDELRKSSNRKKRGPRKYPEDRDQLVEHLKKLVLTLRTEDGGPITSMGEWRRIHPGSYRTAQNARVHLIVAYDLDLVHKNIRSLRGPS